jgi:hypothetical protein
MSDAQRDLVEALVMAGQQEGFDEGALVLAGEGGGAKVMAAMRAHGFTAPQAAEAARYATTEAAALAWLCLHVPEDDLPPAYRPTTGTDLVFVPVRIRRQRGRHAA